jgi:U2-associated protein SR140
MPIDFAHLSKSVSKSKTSPIKKQLPAGFVPSKWETVDPEAVQAQAVTSKWDIFDQEEADRKAAEDDGEEDIDGVPFQEEDNDQIDAKLDELRRERLRDVEVKVMCYQDNLESGKESLKSGWTISDQVSF